MDVKCFLHTASQNALRPGNSEPSSLRPTEESVLSQEMRSAKPGST